MNKINKNNQRNKMIGNILIFLGAAIMLISVIYPFLPIYLVISSGLSKGVLLLSLTFGLLLTTAGAIVENNDQALGLEIKNSDQGLTLETK